jgi:RNA polymerase sigma-70 factor (ECF subfamily)
VLGNLVGMPLMLIETDMPPKPPAVLPRTRVAPGPRHLDAARAGDHLDRLYRAARGLTGSPHEADDLVQETYARVLARPRRVDREKELGYLMTALRHTLIDSRRRRRLQAVSLDELAAEPAARTQRGQPEAAFAAREVYDAIASLPQPDREVIAAVDLAGLSYREAALLLGVPVGTVMSRLSRARAKVGAQFGQCAAA